MSRTHIRKILGDVFSRKGRTALVVLSIMIGVFGVTTLVGMGNLLITQLNDDLDKDEIAMTHVYVVSIGGQISPEENQTFIDQLNGLPGVEQVEGQAIYPIDWHKSGSQDFEAGSVIAFSKPFEDVQLEPVSRVVEGRFPENGQNEIAVEQRFVDEHGVNIGDKIAFRSSEDTEWEIVGIVFQPYQTITPHSTDVTTPATRPETNIYATYEDAQSIVRFPGLTSFSARYSDVEAARAGLNDFIGAVSSETPYITVFSFIDDPDENLLVEGAATITGILSLLGVLSMIVSAFLVVNVINTIVIEQKRQIGVMKSLGASRIDNFLIFAGMALVYGIIGTLLGVIIAVPASSFMAQAIAPLSGTYIDGFHVSTAGIVTGVILGLLIPVLASVIPVYLGTRVTILDAMTDLGIASNWGSTRLSRFIGSLPVPINIRQALSNIFQKRGRLLLTGLTLTLAAGAFMGVTALFTSLDEAIETIFNTFETEITMTTQKAEDPEQIQQILLQNIEEITSITPGYNVSV
ncbi:MAG TPA: FtsX-like permease family protein, partial [Aggregatilineales bacterium]|nr:FtsX-like permease family protein [Aggregatilineales bacterium]